MNRNSYLNFNKKKYFSYFKRIVEVGSFSPPLEQILAFLLKESESIKAETKKENEARKAELNAKVKDIEDRLEQETTRYMLLVSNVSKLFNFKANNK